MGEPIIGAPSTQTKKKRQETGAGEGVRTVNRSSGKKVKKKTKNNNTTGPRRSKKKTLHEEKRLRQTKRKKAEQTIGDTGHERGGETHLRMNGQKGETEISEVEGRQNVGGPGHTRKTLQKQS